MRQGFEEADAPESLHRGRLLHPAVSCPRCGARPALRISEEAAKRVADLDPGERVGTYQCRRRGCGAIYDIPAAAYQNAS